MHGQLSGGRHCAVVRVGQEAECPWIQSAIKTKHIDRLTKIPGKLNPPDILTKAVARDDFERHLRSHLYVGTIVPERYPTQSWWSRLPEGFSWAKALRQVPADTALAARRASQFRTTASASTCWWYEALLSVGTDARIVALCEVLLANGRCGLAHLCAMDLSTDGGRTVRLC